MSKHILTEEKVGEYLRRIQDSEINYRLECFYDNQWRVRLGDETNGWQVDIAGDSLCEVASKLVIAAIVAYPDSQIAKDMIAEGLG